MNSADKILRIAQGGKPITPEMSVADRVMAYAMPEVEPQTQPQLQQLQPLPKNNGLWGGFKDFAGSNAGRTLLGGLGTALAVGLTGGTAKDALGYGVIGAGNTVGVLNKNKQYQDALQEKQLERQRKIDEAELNRQFLQGQQTRLFKNQKELADLQYQKSLDNMLIGKIVDHEWESGEEARKLEAKKNAIRNSGYSTSRQDFLINNLYGMKDDDYYGYLLASDPGNAEALNYFNNKNKAQRVIDPVGNLEKYADVAKAGGMALDVEAANSGNGVFIGKPKDGTDFNSIDSVRKEFNALTSDYRKVGDAFSRIKASYENPTPAGDLSMIFNYMKALDPGSVVRESEFANAENARAWFDNTNVPTFVRLAYEKAVKGNKLLPEQRKDFYDMAVKLFEAQKNSFDNHSQFYKGLAQRRGWDENDIISDPYVFGDNGSADTMVYYKNKYNLE